MGDAQKIGRFSSQLEGSTRKSTSGNNMEYVSYISIMMHFELSFEDNMETMDELKVFLFKVMFLQTIECP